MVDRVSVPYSVTVPVEGYRATPGVSSTSTNIAAAPREVSGPNMTDLALGLGKQYLQYETSQAKHDEGYLQGQANALAKDIDEDRVGFFQRKAYQEGVGRITAVNAVNDMQKQVTAGMHDAVRKGTDPVAFAAQTGKTASDVLKNQLANTTMSAEDRQHVLNGMNQTINTLGTQYKQIWDGVQVAAQSSAASVAASTAARNLMNATDPEGIQSATQELMRSQDIFTTPGAEYSIPGKEGANNIEQALSQVMKALPANGGPLDIARVNAIAEAAWESPSYKKIPATDRAQFDDHVFQLRKDVMATQAAAAASTLGQMKQAVQTPQYADSLVKPDLARADQIVNSAYAALQARTIPYAAYQQVLDARNGLLDALGVAAHVKNLLTDPNKVYSSEDAAKMHKSLRESAVGLSGGEASMAASNAMYGYTTNPYVRDEAIKNFGETLDTIGGGALTPTINPETKQAEYPLHITNFIQQLREARLADPGDYATRISRMSKDRGFSQALTRAIEDNPTATSQEVTTQFVKLAGNVRAGTAQYGSSQVTPGMLKAVQGGYNAIPWTQRASNAVQNALSTPGDWLRGEIGPNEVGRRMARTRLNEATNIAMAEEVQALAARSMLPTGDGAESQILPLVIPGVKARKPDTSETVTAPYSRQIDDAVPAFKALGELRANFLDSKYKAYKQEHPTQKVLGATLQPTHEGFVVNLHVENLDTPVSLPLVKAQEVKDWDVINRANIVAQAQSGRSQGTAAVRDASDKGRGYAIDTNGGNTHKIPGSEAKAFSERLVLFEGFRSQPDAAQGGVIGIGFHPSAGGPDSLHSKFSGLPADQRTPQRAYDMLVNDPRGVNEYYGYAKKQMKALPGFDFYGRNPQDVGTRDLLTYAAYLGGDTGATAVRNVIAGALAKDKVTPSEIMTELQKTSVWKAGNDLSRPWMRSMVIQSVTGFALPTSK